MLVYLSTMSLGKITFYRDSDTDSFQKPAMVAKWSYLPCFKFKYTKTVRSQVQIPARDYDIDRLELDLTFCYSNSRAHGDLISYGNLVTYMNDGTSLESVRQI